MENVCFNFFLVLSIVIYVMTENRFRIQIKFGKAKKKIE